MLHFDTKSSEGNNLFQLNNKLYSKIKFSHDVDGEITKCYWACVNIGKGCKANIRYEVDLIVAGMSNDIIDIITSDHDEDYCTTNATDIVVRNARYNVLEKATEG